MRVKGFYLRIVSSISVLVIVSGAGVVCQKPESAKTKIPETNLAAKLSAYDSTMVVDNARSANVAPEKNNTSAMNKKNDSLVMGSETGYYTCTMHPQVHQTKPGKCPICGMELVYKKVLKKAIKAKAPMPVQ